MGMRIMSPAMRQTLILALLLTSVAVIAGGVYYRVVTDDRRAATSSSRATPSSASTQASYAFVFHDTPKAVPTLSFINGDGHELLLAAFRGRTILLNIWATWCLPCREEMPALERLEEKLGGPEFKVVPLSIDRDGLPKVKSFYEEIGLKSLGIYVDTSTKAGYTVGAVGIPTTLLIDPDGFELGRLVGPAEWDSPELVDIIQQQLERAARKGAAICRARGTINEEFCS